MKKLEADKEELMRKNEEIASMFLFNSLNLCFTSLLNISCTLLCKFCYKMSGFSQFPLLQLFL